ncbi:MAG: fumarylacetoacetate hydrolase family protein [Xanthobacteraceae bacterium]
MRTTRRPAPSISSSRCCCSRRSCSSEGSRRSGCRWAARHLYWTVAQLVAHHTGGGCNLQPGDLFGTGTISGSDDSALGSLLEISAGGRRPVALASGETRRFLEDGDTVIMRARCRREGFAAIGFGDCRGTIAPSI